MCRFIRYSFFIFIVVFGCVNAAEYKPQILPLNVVDAACQPKSINDYGTMVLGYIDNPYHSKMCIFDKMRGMKIIESKGQSIHPIAINNLGQVLGSSYKTFLWSELIGIRYLNVFDSDYNNGIDLNDWGQIIGEYRPKNSDCSEPRRPFLWDNGCVTDMGVGSEFCKQFEVLGYHVMNVTLTSINNNGEIAGYFYYGKINDKKKKYVTLGVKVFFWDGNVHILPLSIPYPPVVEKMNNKGAVLIGVNSGSYLWDRDNGLKPILDFWGDSLNDSTVMLGKQLKSKFDEPVYLPAIWKDGNIITLDGLLGVDDVNNMSPTYSETYEIECLTDFIDINNKDQIGCSASIWKENYPCILEPLLER